MRMVFSIFTWRRKVSVDEKVSNSNIEKDNSLS